MGVKKSHSMFLYFCLLQPDRQTPLNLTDIRTDGHKFLQSTNNIIIICNIHTFYHIDEYFLIVRMFFTYWISRVLLYFHNNFPCIFSVYCESVIRFGHSNVLNLQCKQKMSSLYNYIVGLLKRCFTKIEAVVPRILLKHPPPIFLFLFFFLFLCLFKVRLG